MKLTIHSVGTKETRHGWEVRKDGAPLAKPMPEYSDAETLQYLYRRPVTGGAARVLNRLLGAS